MAVDVGLWDGRQRQLHKRLRHRPCQAGALNSQCVFYLLLCCFSPLCTGYCICTGSSVTTHPFIIHHASIIHTSCVHHSYIMCPSCIHHVSILHACLSLPPFSPVSHIQDEVGEAEQLLRNLTVPNARVKPTSATVMAMLGAYARAGQHDRVQSLFNAMPSLGLQHTSEAYDTLIASCVRSDRWLEALNLLEQLCRGGGGAATPSADCFALVLDALHRAAQGVVQYPGVR